MRQLISICVCLMFLGLPGTSGYAAKIGPQTAPDEETPVAGQKPEVAKVKELLKEGKNHAGQYFGSDVPSPHTRRP